MPVEVVREDINPEVSLKGTRISPAVQAGLLRMTVLR